MLFAILVVLAIAIVFLIRITLLLDWVFAGIALIWMLWRAYRASH
jgi:hypothetical protein